MLRSAKSSAHAEALRVGLLPALRTLQAAQARAQVAAAVRSAIAALAIVAPAMALVVGLGRLTDFPGLAVGLCAGVVLTGGAIRVVRTIAAIRNDRPTSAEAAERLDAASGGGNRIASALNLIEAGDDSPFARAAIADGLARLAAHRQTPPVLPEVHTALGRPALAAVAGMALIGLAALWPMSVSRPSAGRSESNLAISTPTRAADSTNHPVHDNRSTTAPPRPVENEARSAAAGQAGKPGTRAGAGSRAGAAGGQSARPGDRATAGESTNASNGTGGSAGRMAEASKESANSIAGSPARSEQAGAQPSPSASAPPAAAAGRPGAESAGQSGSKSSSANTPPGGSPNTAQARASTGDPQSGSGQQNGQGQRSQSSGESSGGSRAGQSGQGQGTGQSPPKKSRGVPPLMNAERLPDTIAGPPLPGPDERKTVRLPSAPQSAESPRIAVLPPAAPTESAATSFAVPLEDLTAAASYFERLHQADPPPR